MRVLKFVPVFLLLALTLTGCLSLNTIGTIQTMSKLDVVHDPIEEMVFAVEADTNLRPLTDQTHFVFNIAVADNPPQKTLIKLRQAELNEFPNAVSPPAKGNALHIFVFPENEKQKVRDVQAQLQDYKKQKIGGSLNIGVSPRFCKSTPQIPDNSKFSVFVARSKQENLMPLIDNMKISDLENKVGPKALPLCD